MSRLGWIYKVLMLSATHLAYIFNIIFMMYHQHLGTISKYGSSSGPRYGSDQGEGT